MANEISVVVMMLIKILAVVSVANTERGGVFVMFSFEYFSYHRI